METGTKKGTLNEDVLSPNDEVQVSHYTYFVATSGEETTTLMAPIRSAYRPRFLL
jgi:hypothetical protein